LWPYRRSALKNQRRWTFGGVFPPNHSAEHPDDRAKIQAQVLFETPSSGVSRDSVEVSVRFLHVVARRVAREGEFVDELEIDGERYLAWDEATEREFIAGSGRTTFEVPAGSDTCTVGQGEGEIVRSWKALRGWINVETDPVGPQLCRITVSVANQTAWNGIDREDALRRTFCSTHVVLRALEGRFVSLTDPPDLFRTEAEACNNFGVWPVLLGEKGERDTVLASPVILSDYPQIAPESPGDFFDSGEIDRLLILNVLSLTEAEQGEMAGTDLRTREILDRCASLGSADLTPLHGRLRDLTAERE
jgi:hypothetical protein